MKTNTDKRPNTETKLPACNGSDTSPCSALNFEKKKYRFQEVLGSLDRYGTPGDGIVNMLEALSDYIEADAHGYGDFEGSLKIIQDELVSMKADYSPNAQAEAL